MRKEPIEFLLLKEGRIISFRVTKSGGNFFPCQEVFRKKQKSGSEEPL